MTQFTWKGDEGGADYCSAYGVTFKRGVPAPCDHLLPWQANKLRHNPWFDEVPEAPLPQEPANEPAIPEELIRPQVVAPPVDTVEMDERAILKADLDKLGVEYDRRWGVERLRQTLEEAVLKMPLKPASDDA
jgi:hypothetical protein